MEIKSTFTNKGQTIIEAVVSLGIAVFILSAITIAIISSVNNSDFSKNQDLATQYSQQGMEVLKQKSSSDWATFSTYSGTYCLPENSTALSSPGVNGCTTNISNFFIRQVDVGASSDCIGGVKVSVSTLWTDSKCTDESKLFCHNVTLDSCLSNLGS